MANDLHQYVMQVCIFRHRETENLHMGSYVHHRCDTCSNIKPNRGAFLLGVGLCPLSYESTVTQLVHDADQEFIGNPIKLLRRGK